MNTHNMFYGEIQIFYAYMLILSSNAFFICFFVCFFFCFLFFDQIQKISKIDSIYLFKKRKHRIGS